MNSVSSQFKEPSELYKDYVRNQKFQKRYTSLYEDMNSFLVAADFLGKAYINEIILGYALVDYFEDIRRLKNFHGMQHINSIKLVSYTSYWLLRRKPIQITQNDKDLLYINERFILAYIIDFLESSSHGKILERENDGLGSFVEQLFYYLKYRMTNAQSFEMFFMSFFAGRIYQELGSDISSILPDCDISGANQSKDSNASS